MFFINLFIINYYLLIINYYFFNIYSLLFIYSLFIIYYYLSLIGHGKCMEGGECQCFVGFYGNDCENMHTCWGKTNIDSASVCNQHGVCSANNKCDCYPGYSGDQCEV